MSPGNTPIRILHLDDNPTDAELVQLLLENAADKLTAAVTYVSNRKQYTEALECDRFDIILSDYRMPGFDGDEALKIAKEKCPDIPFIMVTGELGEEFAIETLKRGAWDYVMKGNIIRLIPAIERALAEAENLRKRREAEQERERLLREVQRNQAEMMATFQAMLGGVMVFDMEGNTVLVNEAEARILGYPSVEEMERDLAHFTASYELFYANGRTMPPEEWPISRILRGETVVNEELRGRNKDTGKEWFFSFSGQPVRDASGKQILSVIITRDITARKEAEEELRKAHRQVTEILESIQDAFYALDRDFRLTYINRRTEEIWQKHREEVLGKTLQEVFPELQGTEPLETAEEAMRERVPVHQEVLSPVLNRWIDLHVYPTADGGLSVYFRDIDERKRIESALLETDERFRLIQEASLDGFTILRPLYNEKHEVIDFVFVYENAAVARMNGTDPDQVVGRRLLELFPGHRDTHFFQAYKSVAESGKPAEFEDHYRGESITHDTWFRIVVVPAGDTIAILAQDVTSRRKAEEELKERVRACEKALEEASGKR